MKFTRPTSLTSLQPNQLLIPVAIFLFILVAGRWAMDQWHSHLADQDQMLELRLMQRDKYQRIIENSTAYEKLNTSLANMQETVDQKRLFKAASEALSQARFQNLIKDLATKNHIDIRSTRAVSLKAQEQVQRVGLRIDAKGEIGAIRDFLVDLRNDPHYIFISSLEVRTINPREQRYYYLTAELVAIQDL